MGTDIFGTAFSKVRGAARAGRGLIAVTTVDEYDAETEYTILAANIQLQYAQQVQPKLFGGGDMFGVVQDAQGVLQIGAVVGPGVEDLIEASSLETLLSQGETGQDGDHLTLSLEDPSLVGDEDFIHQGGSKYELYNYFVQDYNLSSDPNDPPVMTQVSIVSFNVESVAV